VIPSPRRHIAPLLTGLLALLLLIALIVMPASAETLSFSDSASEEYLWTINGSATHAYPNPNEYGLDLRVINVEAISPKYLVVGYDGTQFTKDPDSDNSRTMAFTGKIGAVEVCDGDLTYFASTDGEGEFTSWILSIDFAQWDTTGFVGTRDISMTFTNPDSFSARKYVATPGYTPPGESDKYINFISGGQIISNTTVPARAAIYEIYDWDLDLNIEGTEYPYTVSLSKYGDPTYVNISDDWQTYYASSSPDDDDILVYAINWDYYILNPYDSDQWWNGTYGEEEEEYEYTEFELFARDLNTGALLSGALLDIYWTGSGSNWTDIEMLGGQASVEVDQYGANFTCHAAGYNSEDFDTINDLWVGYYDDYLGYWLTDHTFWLQPIGPAAPGYISATIQLTEVGSMYHGPSVGAAVTISNETLITTAAGSATFTLTGNSTYTWIASKPGCEGVSGNFTVTTADIVIQALIQQTDSLPTPIITDDSGAIVDTRTREEKAWDAADLFFDNLELITALAFIVVIFSLMDMMGGKRRRK